MIIIVNKKSEYWKQEYENQCNILNDESVYFAKVLLTLGEVETLVLLTLEEVETLEQELATQTTNNIILKDELNKLKTVNN